MTVPLGFSCCVPLGRPPNEMNEYKVTCGVRLDVVDQVRAGPRGAALSRAESRGARWAHEGRSERAHMLERPPPPPGALTSPLMFALPARPAPPLRQVTAAIRETLGAAGVQHRLVVSGSGGWRFMDLVPRQAGKLQVRWGGKRVGRRVDGRVGGRASRSAAQLPNRPAACVIKWEGQDGTVLQSVQLAPTPHQLISLLSRPSTRRRTCA